jgi:hypothetical protein
MTRALSLSVSAQAPPLSAAWQVAAPLDKPPTVGDPITLRLLVSAPAGIAVEPPELPSQWGAFEIRAQQLLDEEAADGASRALLEVQAVLWSPGEHQTPAMNVRYREAGGSTGELFVEPVTVSVASVLPADEGTPEELAKRDLKPQAELPRPPAWPWVLLGLLAVGALALLARWLWRRWPRRHAEGPAATPPEDERPAHQIAYDELARIASLGLPERGEFKSHYTLVTDCLRSYIEGRYGVPAMDRTTWELFRDLQRVALPADAGAILRALLERADLVKFARAQPSVTAAHEALARARSFVDLTRSVVRVQAAGTAEGSTASGGHS